jgi:hypothetical protein
MLPRVLAFLYGSVPATFASDLSVERAVGRLREATAKSPLHSLIREAATGTVTEHKVSLQRAIPLVGNSFKPFFVGRFEVEGGQTQLRGAFTMHWLVKVFMTFWFGFCLLWTFLALATVVAKPTEAWFFPLAGFGMLAAGVSIVAVGKWLARNDQKYLSEVITKALAQSAA